MKYLNCDLVVDKLASRANMKFRIVNFHLHYLETNSKGDKWISISLPVNRLHIFTTQDSHKILLSYGL